MKKIWGAVLLTTGVVCLVVAGRQMFGPAWPHNPDAGYILTYSYVWAAGFISFVIGVGYLTHARTAKKQNS